MKEKRLLSEKMTVGLVHDFKDDDSTPHLVSVGPDHKVSDALQLMNKYGLSQLPVLEDGRSVGSLREGKLMGKLLVDRALMDATVSEVMEKGFPVVNEDDDLDAAVKHLRTSPAILVAEYGRIVGILTRHDVLAAQN
jgi:predicted transcriptional regulator